MVDNFKFMGVIENIHHKFANRRTKNVPFGFEKREDENHQPRSLIISHAKQGTTDFFLYNRSTKHSQVNHIDLRIG